MLPLDYFPYPKPRLFQSELIDKIFASDVLLCSVPTGVGKSVSALCAFLAARDEDEKTVVLTRTKSQAKIFQQEMLAISRKSRKDFLTLHLRSKQELCPIFKNEETSYEEFVQLCKLSDSCEHRSRFYERVESIDELAQRLRGSASPETELEELYSYGCPHLVLQKLLRYADVVVASYLYLLNPNLREIFLGKLGKPLEDLLVIVDEAHNLQNLDILGRTLSVETLSLASKEMDYDFSNVYSLFLGEDCELESGAINPQEVSYLYSSGVELLKSRLRRGKKVSYVFRVASFLDSVLRVANEQNWCFFRQEGKLRLKAIFPSELISPLKQAKKLLLMSGTLSPPEGYAMLYGMEDAKFYSLPNIFPRENCSYLALENGLNSSLKSREELGDALWKKYASAISRLHDKAQNTSLVLFPSYDVLHNIAQHVNGEVVIEPASGEAQEGFWKKARARGRKMIFAVSGGKYSEGVEYTIEENGRRESIVDLVVIAGLPFPVPDFELELRQRRYESRFGGGRAFLLLSVLPMVNKVLQGVGRAIRSESDRAAIVFLDDRLEYFRYFPEEVRHELQVGALEDITEEVDMFCRKGKNL